MIQTAQEWLLAAGSGSSNGPGQSRWHAYEPGSPRTLCGLDLSRLVLWDHPFAVATRPDRCAECGAPARAGSSSD